MPVSLDIKKLTFGSDDAELDEKRGFLSKVFLKTAIYHRAKNSFRELVIGRKGSGKSAICLMLRNALQSEGIKAVLVTPDSLSQYRIQQLKVGSINKDESYVLSWKYVLLVSIAKGILQQALKPKPKQLRENLRKIRDFLVHNDEIEGHILDRISRKVGLFSRFSISAFGVEGAVETRQLEGPDDAASEIEKFQRVLGELLAKVDGIRIALLIDKVDDVWNQTEESEMMIIGLLKAVHALNASLENILLLVFLRSDIYDTLKFSDSDKLHSLEERLRWAEDDLKRLIAIRGKVSANLTEDNVDLLWDVIFESRVKGESSFEYMVQRTLRRPRDLIQFCNNALTEAQDNNHNMITAEDILKAERLYSNWKLKDLTSEYAIQYPYLEELLGLFQAFSSEFIQEQFDEKLQEAKKILTEYPDLQTASTAKILQILFIIGFLGARKDGDAVFVYDDPLILLAEHNSLVVHLAFHLALGLRRLFNEFDQKSTDVVVVGGVVGAIGGRDHVIGSYIESEESRERELKSLSKLNEVLLRNLAKLREQSSVFAAGEAPLHILNQIEDLEAQIQVIQTRIDRIAKQ